MNKEFGHRGRRWNAEGWVCFTLKDVGLGLMLRVQGGFSFSIRVLFLDFHFEVWKSRR
jgi:hypothetical protein